MSHRPHMTTRPQPPARGRPRIMLVEPHAGLRALVALLLRGDGYAVESAGSGEQALMLLARDGADLVLSARELPGISGPALLRVAARRRPGTRGVLMAAGRRGEAAASGVPLVARPLAPADLLDAVAAALAADGSAVA